MAIFLLKDGSEESGSQMLMGSASIHQMNKKIL